MPDYPTIDQHIDSSAGSQTGFTLDRTDSGRTKVRHLHADKRTWTVVHRGTAVTIDEVIDHRLAWDGLPFTFTDRATMDNYSVVYSDEPMQKRYLAPDFWELTINLIEA